MRYITKVTHFLQYIDDDSKGPDVTGQVILFRSQHLWSWKKRGLTNSAKKYLGKLGYFHNERVLTNIVGCVTRRCQSVPCMSLLGKPKVGQLQRSILSCKDTTSSSHPRFIFSKATHLCWRRGGSQVWDLCERCFSRARTSLRCTSPSLFLPRLRRWKRWLIQIELSRLIFNTTFEGWKIGGFAFEIERST